MTEGIEYHPIGTVDVTFDDKTYHLGPPKLKQWRYFGRRIPEISVKAQDDLAAITRRLADAQQAVIDAAEPLLRDTYELAIREAQAEDATMAHVQARDAAWVHILEAAEDTLRNDYEAVREDLSKFADRPFYYRSSELVKEMFQQLGDPLPDDIDEWPAWLATDVELPRTIHVHWRTNPKASGSNGAQ